MSEWDAESLKIYSDIFKIVSHASSNIERYNIHLYARSRVQNFEIDWIFRFDSGYPHAIANMPQAEYCHGNKINQIKERINIIKDIDPPPKEYSRDLALSRSHDEEVNFIVHNDLIGNLLRFPKMICNSWPYKNRCTIPLLSNLMILTSSPSQCQALGGPT